MILRHTKATLPVGWAALTPGRLGTGRTDRSMLGRSRPRGQGRSRADEVYVTPAPGGRLSVPLGLLAGERRGHQDLAAYP